MAAGLILAVEDDPDMVKYYRTALSAVGHTVLAATSAEEGLTFLDMHRPRLLILDINLPGINGIEACRRARRDYGNDFPILFITTNDDLGTLRDCMAAGGDDFMVKGAPFRAILERVGYWMDESRTGAGEERRRKILARAEEELRLMNAETAIRGNDAKKVERDQIEQIAKLVWDHKQSFARNRDLNPAERFHMVGFATGAVNARTSADLRIRLRFMDILAAVLRESGLLEPDDALHALRNLHEHYNDDAFRKACAEGEAAAR
ncbi:MAG: response regulator [Alphaproteobacteria bacterium]|nr:response regulator [Alphaproteobacteria bacterium]